jgi:peptidase S41-like protein
VKVPGISDSEFKSHLEQPKWNAENQPFGLHLLDSATAVLTIPTFAPPSGFDFPRFLADSIANVNRHRIKNLILDLRGNDGGESFGPAIAASVLAHSFRPYRSMTARTNDLSLLTAYSKLSPDFVSGFGKSLKAVRPDVFEVLPSIASELEVQKPITHPYLGKLWVLVDGEVFSAASALCSVLKTEHRAIFVGEETGGAYSGFSGGDFVVPTLPNSKIRIIVPLYRIHLASEAEDDARRGIQPDLRFEPSVGSVIRGVDSEMNFVRRLIANGGRHLR